MEQIKSGIRRLRVRIIEIEGDSHEVFGRNEAVFVGKFIVFSLSWWVMGNWSEFAIIGEFGLMRKVCWLWWVWWVLRFWWNSLWWTLTRIQKKFSEFLEVDLLNIELLSSSQSLWRFSASYVMNFVWNWTSRTLRRICSFSLWWISLSCLCWVCTHALWCVSSSVLWWLRLSTLWWFCWLINKSLMK
jgi:hypothetical protein